MIYLYPLPTTDVLIRVPALPTRTISIEILYCSPTVSALFKCNAFTRFLPCVLSAHVVLIALSVGASSRSLSCKCACLWSAFTVTEGLAVARCIAERASWSSSWRGLLGRIPRICGVLPTLVEHHSHQALRSMEPSKLRASLPEYAGQYPLAGPLPCRLASVWESLLDPEELIWKSQVFSTQDKKSCCFYDLVRNSLAVLLEAILNRTCSICSISSMFTTTPN